ncbi:MAG TPA: flagellar filament capping protein FliD [Polyangiaceae bacterium]|jgi:flagellar hook-associated protein 2
MASSTTSALSLSGLGSGIDTQSLIQGLVQVESQPMQALQTKQQNTQAAVSTLSNISTALSTLQTAVNALTTATGVGSNTATSSSSAIAVSTTGAASPGAYSLSVTQLAQEQRTYSNTFGSASTALNQSGSLTLQVGSGSTAVVNIDASDTLDQVASKINGAGLRVSASVFFDGNQYRLQIRGLDTGKDNAVSIAQSGVSFGFDDPKNTVQSAQNSIVQLDGFNVERSTNQVVGAIPGVTLALTAKTDSPVNIQVASDPHGLETKLQAVVTAYNSIVSQIQASKGTLTTNPDGTTTSSGNPVLAGDFALSSIRNRLSDTLGAQFSTGQYTTLGSIGLALQRDGTLSLDTDKLETVLTNDPTSVTKLLAGQTDGSGAMSALSSAIDMYTQTGTGLLVQEQDDMTSSITDLGNRISTEQERLNTYQTLLTAQFTAMDTLVTGNNSNLSAIQQAFASLPGINSK